MSLLPMLATAAALLALFAASEFAGRHGLAPETTRRLIHVMGAGTTAVFPFYLRLNEVVALAVAFTVFLSWTRLRGELLSVHGVSRPTAGALVFPAGLLLAAIAVWSRPAAFSYAALVLALADPAAAVMGTRVKSATWRVARGYKSVLGSLTFFAVAFVLGTSLSLAVGRPSIPAAAGAAAVLTAVEGALGYGLDNLFIPVIAGLLGEQWLRL